MVEHIIHILIFAVAVLLTARIVPGIRVKSFGSAVFFAFVLAILDKLLFGLLIFLAFPFVLLSFGLFLLVINAALWLLANRLVKGIEMTGFGAALLGSVVTSALNLLILWLVH